MVWAAGQQLQNGKYRIEEVLGQGCFGITYKALHLRLWQQVVIKTPNEFLSRDPDYDKYVERFINEGQILARLSQDPHPHIVGVIDLFQEGEIHCLVMDYIAGENLFGIVKRQGALPEAEVLECFRQIGEALTVVHQAGLVHRDAHPGNIMLRPNGKAILIDFGIAGELVPTTVSSMNPGNQRFAPYEQMSGDRNPTVDVYCLTATLYFAVTGQKPPTSLDRKLYAVRLIPPKEIFPSISDKLNQAILKGMALEAKNRPQTMEALLKLLEVSQVVKPPILKQAWLKLLKALQPVKSQVVKPPIPWLALTGYILLYAGIGFLLAMPNKPPEPPAIGGALAVMISFSLIWFLTKETWAEKVAVSVSMIVAILVTVAVAVGMTMAGDWAGAISITSVLFGAWAWAWAWAWFGAGAGAWAGTWAGAGAVGATVAMTWVGDGNWAIAMVLVGVLSVALFLILNSQDDRVFNNLFITGVLFAGGALVGAGGGALVGSRGGALIGSGAGASATSIMFVGSFTITEVGKRLDKHFSKFNTFITMAITSGIGLVLGWLGHWVFWR
ncbi:serine/threonine protein kinase [Cylindrospermum sp. FACHB-282]|uniref:serine/threonine protein kinase n=1 Tax=Cylindrospermum sp. FACHB-282 TaxID=2692794 RepID=UPI001688F319|nr:serine/threonine-protein kinase [Cylindrospermum sp. FACHB-282]MBD2387895.1 serine/threonine protein kinase [Cylindrospermum sp. FACHB-282]